MEADVQKNYFEIFGKPLLSVSTQVVEAVQQSARYGYSKDFKLVIESSLDPLYDEFVLDLSRSAIHILFLSSLSRVSEPWALTASVYLSLKTLKDILICYVAERAKNFKSVYRLRLTAPWPCIPPAVIDHAPKNSFYIERLCSHKTLAPSKISSVEVAFYSSL